MGRMDKELRRLAEETDVPDTYKKRVDETLKNLQITDSAQKKRSDKMTFLNGRSGKSKLAIRLAACGIVLFCCVLVYTVGTSAGIFVEMKRGFMDFFDIASEEEMEKTGVEGQKQYAESKPDLVIELTETVVEKNAVYALVRITAPSSVTFSDQLGFEYFAFCEGENYNTDKLISGATDCKLLEVSEEKQNIATYVVSISTEQLITDGETLTVSLMNLMRDPFGDEPEMIVEGIWSLSFSADYTVTEEINVEGNRDMAYPFLDHTAYVENIYVSPLGMTLMMDISEVPQDILGISDTYLRVRLVSIDGESFLLMSHDLEEDLDIGCSSMCFEENNGKYYQEIRFEFENPCNINTLVGVYIEDLYIPFE